MFSFSPVVDTMFATYGVEAEYASPAGAITPCLVIRVSAMADSKGWGETVVRSRSNCFEVRRSEMALPEEEAIITIEATGESFIVQGEPALDEEGLIWRLDTRPE